MKVERSAGALIFYEGKKRREYLLLKHSQEELEPKEYWNFPKGHLEKGETSQGTARRETFEETGLKDIMFISGFKETERYIYAWKGKKILKFVVWFLAKSKSKRVKVSWEHTGAAWLPYDKAHKKVFYAGSKRLLKKAEIFLRKKDTISPSRRVGRRPRGASARFQKGSCGQARHPSF